MNDVRFSTTPARIKNRAEVEALVQERLREKTADEWMELMDQSGSGVPFAPINSLDRVFSDPQVTSREIVTEVIHPVTGPIKMVGMPVRYDEDRGKVRLPPPRLGEHNHEILTCLLGYSDENVNRLKEEGVI
jgi:crotonobetainyl-CoA:carnitine CoA-transferase CaiB-like acyl-CoA transferase